mmetsp:Transcript_42452/g.136528  ORF Transcript_42452/g.136528 Transcript_42452/m.136528 type:complete len:344 (-) Transcript_42452:834-1865(-)
MRRLDAVRIAPRAQRGVRERRGVCAVQPPVQEGREVVVDGGGADERRALPRHCDDRLRQQAVEPLSVGQTHGKRKGRRNVRNLLVRLVGGWGRRLLGESGARLRLALAEPRGGEALVERGKQLVGRRARRLRQQRRAAVHEPRNQPLPLVRLAGLDAAQRRVQHRLAAAVAMVDHRPPLPEVDLLRRRLAASHDRGEVQPARVQVARVVEGGHPRARLGCVRHLQLEHVLVARLLEDGGNLLHLTAARPLQHHNLEHVLLPPLLRTAVEQLVARQREERRAGDAVGRVHRQHLQRRLPQHHQHLLPPAAARQHCRQHCAPQFRRVLLHRRVGAALLLVACGPD